MYPMKEENEISQKKNHKKLRNSSILEDQHHLIH